MKTLDFNDIEEESLIDDLTFSCLAYNVDECGVRWEDLVQLFGPDTIQAAMARYEMMRGNE